MLEWREVGNFSYGGVEQPRLVGWAVARGETLKNPKDS